jgi:mannose-6-phosphate isomerase-like protein (cupin superfamily)
MMTSMSEPFIVLKDQEPPLDLGTFQVSVLATAEQTAGQFSVLQTRDEPPGFGPPLHLHRDAAEAFFILQGEYLMFLEDRQQLCPPGSFAYVPAGTPHTFKVTSTAPGTKLNLFSPAAMVGFFEELAIAESSGGATLERLGEIAEQNCMEVLGPVPQSYL